MKFILVIVVLVIVGGSLWADYRWRKWMAARSHERNEERNRHVK